MDIKRKVNVVFKNIKLLETSMDEEAVKVNNAVSECEIERESNRVVKTNKEVKADVNMVDVKLIRTV